MLSGEWTYRSYKNDPALVGGDAAAALALIFGEGLFEFAPGSGGDFVGRLDMGAGYGLTLSGKTLGGGEAPHYAIVGLGVPGTPTAGWRYDYRCSPGFAWPEGADQVPSLLGTVVRVNAHGAGAPAGYTASFIAVRRESPPASAVRTGRQNVLTVGL